MKINFTLQNVVVQVDEAVNVEVSPNYLELGDIEAKSSVLTEEVITVSYSAPSSQDAVPPKQQLKWRVDYTAPQMIAEGFASGEQRKANKIEKNDVLLELPALRLSEIMFFPKETEPEWIELYNASEQAVDIAGYEISNSENTVYSFPEALPPLPAGAFVLVLFDGKSSMEDDISFKDDYLATLHATQQNIFADDGDSCMIFSGRPHSAKMMQAFAAWGDVEDSNASVKAFAQHAVKKGLRSKHAATVYAVQPEITGPVQRIEAGGSLIFERSKATHGGLTAIPSRVEEATPGSLNVLPSPQLWRPRNGLKTSADIFTFSWIPTTSSAKYEIQIAKDKAYTNIIHESIIDQPYFTPPYSFPRKLTLYWRVRTLAGNKVSGWSEARSFNVAYADNNGGAYNESKTLSLSATGLPNPLGVPNRAARKDSSLLCVLCDDPRYGRCDAAHWDSSNATGPLHSHSFYYCWAAAAQMLAMYRGGDILQDEIVSTVKGNITATAQPSPALPHGKEPEFSLPHGETAGASKAQDYHAVRLALQATQTQLHEQTSKPTAAELREFIDSGRPLWYENFGHAMIVDGYRTESSVFQARFLNTDNNGVLGVLNLFIGV